jgi:hypothetical protein
VKRSNKEVVVPEFTTGKRGESNGRRENRVTREPFKFTIDDIDDFTFRSATQRVRGSRSNLGRDATRGDFDLTQHI